MHFAELSVISVSTAFDCLLKLQYSQYKLASDYTVLKGVLQYMLWYHGTHSETAGKIAKEGFRSFFFIEDEEEGMRRTVSSGHLGRGIYLTAQWRTALDYGDTLLEVSLIPGTQWLDMTTPMNKKILGQLVREFGHQILTKPAWEALPRNKKLTREELVALTRYFYQQERRYMTGRGEAKASRLRNWRLFLCARSMLIRHDFHGFGEAAGENGVVIFADGRIQLQKGVIQKPKGMSWDRWYALAECTSLEAAIQSCMLWQKNADTTKPTATT